MDWDGAVLSLMAWAFTDDGSKHEKLKEWHFEHMSKFDDPNIRLKSPVDLDAFQQLKSRMIQINRGDNDYIKKPAYLNFAEHRLNAALRKFDEAVLFQVRPKPLSHNLPLFLTITGITIGPKVFTVRT